MMMIIFAVSIFAICYLAGIRTIVDAVKSWDEPRSRYVFAKGLVILYLGTMYGIVAVDYWFKIVNLSPSTLTGQLLRMASLVTSFVFLADSWIRNK